MYNVCISILSFIICFIIFAVIYYSNYSHEGYIIDACPSGYHDCLPNNLCRDNMTPCKFNSIPSAGYAQLPLKDKLAGCCPPEADSMLFNKYINDY